MSRQQFCPNPVSYKCQTVLAVSSVEYVSSQTLWEVVCKGNVNKNYCRMLLRKWRHVSVFSAPVPHGSGSWPAVTSGSPFSSANTDVTPRARTLTSYLSHWFQIDTSAGSLYTRCSYHSLCTDLCQTTALVTQKRTKAGPKFMCWPMDDHSPQNQKYKFLLLLVQFINPNDNWIVNSDWSIATFGSLFIYNIAICITDCCYRVLISDSEGRLQSAFCVKLWISWVTV